MSVIYMAIHRGFNAAALAAACLGVPGLSPATAAQARSAKMVGRHFEHVVIVVMENEGTEQALADPYIGYLARKGAWFSNYHAITHPSFPNYLAIVAGSTFGFTSDLRQPPLKRPTIADRLEARGLTWKSYAEDYPGGCFQGNGAGSARLTPRATPTWLYARKHLPLLAFASIQNDPRRCGRVVAGTEFMRDAQAGRLPHYSFYTPNMFDDGHDTSLDFSSHWLERFMRGLESTVSMRQRTLVVITWDEGGPRDNRVLTLLIGNVVRSGKYTVPLNHFSLLRTIEDNFGLARLAAGDRHAPPFPESVWKRQ